jgi:hypothetical protein
VPTGITNSTNLSASLTGEPGTTFQCRVDGDGWSTCTSPVTRTGLADGTHSIEARLLDGAGNAGPAARLLWTIDTAPPSDPPAFGDSPAVTSDSTPTFTFTGDGSTTFECQVNGGGWAPCTSPFTTDPLIGGAHTLQVRQVDVAGNVGPVATIAFTVDNSAPAEVEVTGIPQSPTNETSATLSFAIEDGAVLECRIDGSAWQSPCPFNPLTMSGLTQGTHEVVVRQRDTATPPNYSYETAVRWTVDTTAPLAPGTAPRPANPTNSPDAAIGITSEPGTVTECRFMGGAWQPCVNPVAYPGLADGSYTLDVRSTDAAGNVSTTSAVRWSVDTVPPTGTAVVTSGPTNPTASSVAVFNFTLGSDGASAQCSLDGAAWSPCVSPVTYGGIAPGSHSLRLRILDAAGNVGANITTFNWEMFVPPNPPSGTPGVMLNGGAAYATDRIAVADIIWPVGTRFIELANLANFSDAVRSPISTQEVWALSPGAAGNRTVHFRFLDGAAAVIATGSTSIVLDADAPIVASIALERGDGDSVTVTPNLNDPVSGLDSWQATIDPAAPGALLPASRISTQVTASGGQSVYVRARDRAGNVSPWVSAVVPRAPAVAPPAAGGQDAFIVLTGTTVRNSGEAVVSARCQSQDECRVRVIMVINGIRVSGTERVLGPGASAQLVAKLPATLQRRLAVRGTMRAVVTTEVTSGGQAASQDQSITLVAPNARRVVQVQSAPLRRSRDRLTVAARCVGSLPQRCRATVDLQLVGVAPGRRSSNQITSVGRARMEGPTGVRLGTTIVLTPAGRRLLRTHGMLRVRPIVTIAGTRIPGRVVVIGGMSAPAWIRAVLSELHRKGDARATLNGLLDQVEAGTLSPRAGADAIERIVQPARAETLARLKALPPPPARMDYLRRDVLAAFTTSIAANTATIGHLRAGGKPTNDPNSRLHVRATEIKARLMAGMAREAKPLGIAVPPARSLWP